MFSRRITTYLYISKTGNVRITKKPVTPRANEIRVMVNLAIPSILFERPAPVINIKLPDTLTSAPIEAVVATTAKGVAESLNASVEDVYDGLMHAVIKASADRSESDDAGER